MGDLTHYQAVLADLEEKRDTLDEERQLLDAKQSAIQDSIASIRRVMALESGEITPLPVEDVRISKSAFRNLDIPKAARKYLEMTNTGQSNPELARAFIKGGMKHTKWFKDTVRSSLNRKGEQEGLVYIEAKWWLKEWAHTPRPTAAAVAPPPNIDNFPE